MKKPWKIILAFGGIFVAGAIVGGFVTLRMHPPPTVIMPAIRLEPAPAQVSPHMIRRLTQRLELSAEQQEQIRPIIGTAEREVQRLRRESLHETMAVSRQMYEHIAPLLTPEQKENLDRMQQEALERMAQERQQRLGERPGLAPLKRPEPHLPVAP